MTKTAVRFFLLVKKWMHSPILWIILLLSPVIPYIVNRTVLPGRENSRILLYVPEGSEYAQEVADYLVESDSRFTFMLSASEEEAIRNIETAYADTAFLFADDLDEKTSQMKPQKTITVVSSSYSSKTEVAKETVYAAFYHVYTRVLMRKAADTYFPDRMDASGSPVSTDEIYDYMLKQSGYYAENGNLFEMKYRSIRTSDSTSGDPNEKSSSGLFTLHGIYALLLFMVMILAGAPSSDAGRTGSGVLEKSLRADIRYRFRYINILASAAIPAVVFFILFLISEPLWAHGLPNQSGGILFSRGSSAVSISAILVSILAELGLWILYILLAAVWAAAFSQVFTSTLTYNAWLLTLLAVNLIFCPIFYDLSDLHRIPGILGRLLPVGAYLHILGLIR